MQGPWEVAPLGGVVVLEEVCVGVALCAWVLRCPRLKLCPVQKRASFWLSLDQDVELSASPAPCLLSYCHIPPR
ncbi:rCG43231 [Rattus norvegicus]|uniref:RCG43231 n=1 Tax=Rattus norvegicus TaxID=10116 RepID=A6IWC7_RAT|nr:rCG43231 [Rattus norvegicus]